jgi:hypothetical protein
VVWGHGTSLVDSLVTLGIFFAVGLPFWAWGLRRSAQRQRGRDATGGSIGG